MQFLDEFFGICNFCDLRHVISLWGWGYVCDCRCSSKDFARSDSLGEMLSADINMVGFSWITSPAATELEMIVLDWLGKLLKLPEEFLSTGKFNGEVQCLIEFLKKKISGY